MILPEPPRLQITGKTKVMFIMGAPVAQVVGSAVLNAAWARENRDMVVVPLHVEPADLPHMLDMVRKSPTVAGTGLTIPHKIAAAALVDQLTCAAANAGAVNFVRREADGALTGHNIDGAGFLAGLAKHGIDPAGRAVVMSGAGGVARAIAFALAGAGARSLVLRNRDRAKAGALAAELRAWSGVECREASSPDALGEVDILVNATSLGLRREDPTPFSADEIPEGAVAAEVIMSPAVTRFMTLAKGKRCLIVPGRAMLDPQARLVTNFLDGDPP